MTDLLDGLLARRLEATTSLGSYFDAVADFAVLLAAFAALVELGVYPWLLLAIMIAMFAQFVPTSRRGRLAYDPVGKYYGTALYGAALITLALPDEALCQALYLGALALSAVSVVSRYVLARAWVLHPIEGDTSRGIRRDQ